MIMESRYQFIEHTQLHTVLLGLLVVVSVVVRLLLAGRLRH